MQISVNLILTAHCYSVIKRLSEICPIPGFSVPIHKGVLNGLMNMKIMQICGLHIFTSQPQFRTEMLHSSL